MCSAGGVCSRGFLLHGGYLLLGGVYSQGCLLQGVSAPGGCLFLRGVFAPGGVCLLRRGVCSQGVSAPPPRGQTDVCTKRNLRNFVADGKYYFVTQAFN